MSAARAASATPELAAWRGLVRIQGVVRRHLGAALETAEGLSVWDFTVLRTLIEAPGRRMRMSDLARATDYTPSGLTRLVGRLEGAGLVERRPCPEDGRGAVAALTPQGRRVFARARRVHLDAVREHFVGRCTEQELVALIALWERLLPGSTS